MKKKEIFSILLRTAVALTLFLIAIFNYDTLSQLDVRQLVSFTDHTSVMIAVILAVYLVKALVFVVPASLVYVAVGAILPPVTAVAVNLVGIFIEVSATYWLGRFLGKEAVYRLLSKRAAGRKIIEKDLGSNNKVLLAIRAIPAFPIDLLSLFYGASGCRYLPYALFSLLGISWRVILFTLIGDAVFAWIPMDKIIFIVILCIPVGVAWFLIKKFVLEPKKKKKADAGMQEKQNTENNDPDNEDAENTDPENENTENINPENEAAEEQNDC